MKPAPLRLFLDANVLFSAALDGPLFQRLWLLAGVARVVLLTSAHCVEEARRNVNRKRPNAAVLLEERIAVAQVSSHASVNRVEWVRTLVPDHDVHVLAAAVESEADVLITGDVKHFGALMRRGDLPLRVRTIRAFMLEGPGA